MNRQNLDVEFTKDIARKNNLAIITQPLKKDNFEFIKQVYKLKPDLIFIWSYSMILPVEIIKIPVLGCINMHGGLLPEYQGAHVMGWALVNGEKETGQTLHYIIDEGIDTGPIIAQEKFAIDFQDDANDIRKKLKKAGVKLIHRWWNSIILNCAPRIIQDKSKMKYYRLRTPDDGLIDWSYNNIKVYNIIRTHVKPWSGAYSFCKNKKILIWKAKPGISNVNCEAKPGYILDVSSDEIQVVTGDGLLCIYELEMDGNVYEIGTLEKLNFLKGAILGVENNI